MVVGLVPLVVAMVDGVVLLRVYTVVLLWRAQAVEEELAR